MYSDNLLMIIGLSVSLSLTYPLSPSLPSSLHLSVSLSPYHSVPDLTTTAREAGGALSIARQREANSHRLPQYTNIVMVAVIILTVVLVTIAMMLMVVANMGMLIMR